jgi:hypothetical protein
VREQAGRAEDPSAVVLDTQTVHTSINSLADTTGLDPGKKSRGRKRGIASDVLGVVIAVVVTAASVHDNAIGTAHPHPAHWPARPAHTAASAMPATTSTSANASPRSPSQFYANTPDCTSTTAPA